MGVGVSFLIRKKSLDQQQPRKLPFKFPGLELNHMLMWKAITETWNRSIFIGLEQWLSNFNAYQNHLEGLLKQTPRALLQHLVAFNHDKNT